MKKIDENQKVTLTFGQLKKLVSESGDDPRVPELEKILREILEYTPISVTISGDTFTCGDIRFRVDVSEKTPWKAISVDKPVIIKGPLAEQIAGYTVAHFIEGNRRTLQRIVDLFM